MTPPMVGVPILVRWRSGPSTRMILPILKWRSMRTSGPPQITASMKLSIDRVIARVESAHSAASRALTMRSMRRPCEPLTRTTSPSFSIGCEQFDGLRWSSEVQWICSAERPALRAAFERDFAQFADANQILGHFTGAGADHS